MKTFLLLVASVSALAQIERPRIGVMLDASGNAREVLGVAESATAADPSWSGILSLACSAEVCFGKTQDALVSSTGDSIDAPPGPAIFGMDGGSAYVYFTASRQLMRWHDGELDPVVFSPDGDVLALRATADGFESAVRRADGAWAGDRYLGDATAVALLDGGSVVAAGGGQVRLLRPDGTEADFAVAGVQSLIRISDICVQLVTASGMWALAIESGRERVFLLPGGSQ
jgi:hypothetical protein